MNDKYNYENSYFLSGKDSGFCKRLVGKVLFYVFLIDFDDTQWSEEERNIIFDKCKSVQSIFKDESSKYNKNISFINKFSRAKLNMKKPQNINDVGAAIDTAIKDLGYNNVFEFLKKSRDSHKCDEILLLFFPNVLLRSYAVRSSSIGSSSSEYAVLFSRDVKIDSIIHETMHVFGAPDLYYPDYVYDYAREYFPKSVMSGDGLIIDDLTCYIIGWRDSLTSRTIGFLDQMKNVDTDYIVAELKKEWAKSENNKSTSNSEKGLRPFNKFEKKLKRKVCYSSGKISYVLEYNKNGDIIYSKRRDMNFSNQIKWNISISANQYDENGWLTYVENTNYSGDNKLEQITQIYNTYDNHGNRIYTRIIDDSKISEVSYVNSYYVSGKIKNISKVIEGKKVYSIDYDEQGRKLFYTEYSRKDESEKTLFKYVYDSFGNIIYFEAHGDKKEFEYESSGNTILQYEKTKDGRKLFRTYVLDKNDNCIEMRDEKGNLMYECEYYMF